MDTDIELRYIILKVKELSRAKEFYTKLLGYPALKEEKGRIVVFLCRNMKIGLYNPLADGDELSHPFSDNCRPAFGTNNLEKELKRVSKFATITNQKKVGKHEWFEFNDSEGNPLEIHKK